MCTSLTISVPTVYVEIGDSIEDQFAIWLYPTIVSNQQAVTFIEVDQTTERTKCLIKNLCYRLYGLSIFSAFSVLKVNTEEGGK